MTTTQAVEDKDGHSNGEEDPIVAAWRIAVDHCGGSLEAVREGGESEGNYVLEISGQVSRVAVRRKFLQVIEECFPEVLGRENAKDWPLVEMRVTGPAEDLDDREGEEIHVPRVTLGSRADAFRRIGSEIGELVAEKNQAYGSAFSTAGAALRLLYPGGIRPEQYDDVLALTRIWDKMMRIATKRDAFGESPYRDIAGYGILGAERVEKS